MATIGERIRELRNGWLTQVDLATKAEVSVDLIRKLEQGQRHTASVASLARIARALDVDMAQLISKPTPPPSSDPHSGIVAIRQVLTSVDDLIDGAEDAGEPLTAAEAERSVDYLWGAYWAGRYELLASVLPNTLTQLKATYRAARADDKPRVAEALARAYQAAGDTLVHLGQTDAAFLAIRAALDVARHGDDPLLYAALRMSVAWQMLIQGRFAESERVAITAAGDIEPSGDVSLSQISAYGILMVTAATAAARSQKVDTTNDLLAASRDMATRIGYDRADHQTTFGPAKVAMLTVDCHIVLDNFPEALQAAKKLSPGADLRLATRARHLADVAYANARLGHDEQAVTTLVTMEHLAPDWIKYQTLPRQITRELLARERRRTSRLHDLADRLGVRNVG